MGGDEPLDLVVPLLAAALVVALMCTLQPSRTITCILSILLGIAVYVIYLFCLFRKKAQSNNKTRLEYNQQNSKYYFALVGDECIPLDVALKRLRAKEYMTVTLFLKDAAQEHSERNTEENSASNPCKDAISEHNLRHD